MNNSRDEKKELRRQCLEIRQNVPEKDEKDRRIRHYLSSLVSYRFASLLLFYAPIKGEVDVFPLISAALEKEKKVALPRCEDRFGQMTFRLIRDVGELTPGIFGSPEPSETALRVSDTDLSRPDAFALIPALAYDREGYRLGYGEGYYDRFLSGFGGTSAGIFYSDLLFNQLPRGFFDRKVSLLVSDRGVILPDA